MLIRTRIPVAQIAVTMVDMSARMDRISRIATSVWFVDGVLILVANVRSEPTGSHQVELFVMCYCRQPIRHRGIQLLTDVLFYFEL